jgi:hypothetical protein
MTAARIAVELARQGTAPAAKIAKDLGISELCLRNRMAQADADDNGSQVKLTSTEKRSWPNCAARTASLRW